MLFKGDTIVQISEDESKEKMMAGLDLRGSIEAYRVLQGLHMDNGKGNGNYHNGLYRGWGLHLNPKPSL